MLCFKLFLSFENLGNPLLKIAIFDLRNLQVTTLKKSLLQISQLNLKKKKKMKIKKNTKVSLELKRVYSTFFFQRDFGLFH